MEADGDVKCGNVAGSVSVDGKITCGNVEGRNQETSAAGNKALPWKNDESLHAVLYQGHTLLKHQTTEKEMSIVITGAALNVYSEFNVNCEEVYGNVSANGMVLCDNV